SWHWFAVDTSGTLWFVTADDPAGPFPVKATYPLAKRLQDDGLEFVRGPRAGLEGQVIENVDGLLMSVWPWVRGRASDYGRHATAADLDATTACLVRLHGHGGVDPVAALIEDWALSGRTGLERVLTEPRGDGPYAAETTELLTSGRSGLHEELARYDGLVTLALSIDPRFVITHGEPHAGNVIHTEAGARLIDWDTVKWAPIERDLWHLVDYDNWDRGYGTVVVNDNLIELYRLNWELSEVADFAVLLLGAKHESPDHEIAMRELRNYLA
ncbi:MAG: phosphotransferase, partial [Acidimicrobiia bacterium]|nr:phosphotransferase [Acidimicrobiia bacterium]